MLENGINASINAPRVLLNYPVERSLELVAADGSVVCTAPLAEDILPSDPTSDTWWRNHTFNGYSPSGNATAPVVYANFGLPEDFVALKAAGVDVRGKVVLMRYGKCFRGLKAMNAQVNGALAALIYSDPEQDGYAKGSVYPYGPWRPPSSVQRGSIQFISICAGDPSRAYLPPGDVEKVCGRTQEELIPQIPVMPLSYGDALLLLEQLGGEEAPDAFRGALNITYRTGPSQGVQACTRRLALARAFGTAKCGTARRLPAVHPPPHRPPLSAPGAPPAARPPDLAGEAEDRQQIRQVAHLERDRHNPRLAAARAGRTRAARESSGCVGLRSTRLQRSHPQTHASPGVRIGITSRE